MRTSYWRTYVYLHDDRRRVCRQIEEFDSQY